MALGSVARVAPNTPGLLPCRIHNFFRGLPGLWVCMDPKCSEIDDGERDDICGKMYSQPRDLCECGARVLELYTCRNCGTAYARAYTDDVDVPQALWSEAGQRLRLARGETTPLLPLDLLLEQPAIEAAAEPADYDIETGHLNPQTLGPRTRTVYVRSDRVSDATEDNDETSPGLVARGEFAPCAVCGKTARFGRSYVQDHQTKGDQPFQALVARQIQIQPPAPIEASGFAPLQGRKVLIFSDSRQVAARLAPNLQMYSMRDSLRPLIAWGYRRLQRVPSLGQRLNLDDLYLAVLLASKKLRVRLRPEMTSGESFAAEDIVDKAITNGETENDMGLFHLCFEFRNERPPESLLDNIVTTVQDRFLGFEALALASIGERSTHSSALERLPTIPLVAESPEAQDRPRTGLVALLAEPRILAERDAARLVEASTNGGYEHPRPERQVQSHGYGSCRQGSPGIYSGLDGPRSCWRCSLRTPIADSSASEGPNSRCCSMAFGFNVGVVRRCIDPCQDCHTVSTAAVRTSYILIRIRIPSSSHARGSTASRSWRRWMILRASQWPSSLPNIQLS